VGLLLLLSAGGAPADSKDDPKGPDTAATPREQFDTLTKQVNEERQAILSEYRKTEDAVERRRILARYYGVATRYARRFIKLAGDNPKDPVAVDALAWVVTQPYAKAPPEVEKAFRTLLKDQVKSEAIGKVCRSLVYSRSPQARNLLRAVLEKNPKKEVKGQAAYALGVQLKRSNPREAEKLFERAAKDAPEVKANGGWTIGKLAEGELFEARHLAIGKKAPEIEGEDIDGKKFKLSDYKGKVVVLDFWGNW
jgi:hypothetical protein